MRDQLGKRMPVTYTFRQTIPMYTYASGWLVVSLRLRLSTPIGQVVPPATKLHHSP